MCFANTASTSLECESAAARRYTAKSRGADFNYDVRRPGRVFFDFEPIRNVNGESVKQSNRLRQHDDLMFALSTESRCVRRSIDVSCVPSRSSQISNEDPILSN